MSIDQTSFMADFAIFLFLCTTLNRKKLSRLDVIDLIVIIKQVFLFRGRDHPTLKMENGKKVYSVIKVIL